MITRILAPAFLISAAVVCAMEESPLFPCPDCKAEVSRRAMMCPKCGCPGDAIRQAVAEDKERKRPKRLGMVVTDQRKAGCLFVTQGDGKYVVMDFSVLGETSSLEIRELDSGKQVAYSDPELSPDSALLRFKVRGAPDVEFLPVAKEPETGPCPLFLTAKDGILPITSPGNPVALLNAGNQAAVFMAGKERAPLYEKQPWVPVRPDALLAQAALLARASDATSIGSLPGPLSAELKATAWLTPYLKQVSAKLSETSKP